MKKMIFQCDPSSSSFPYGLGNTGSQSFTSESSGAHLTDRPIFEIADLDLKTMYEGYITKMLVEKAQSSVDEVDDPFDAVYLADLEPDRISLRDLNKLEEFSNIIDLSDSIDFDDDWED